VESSVAERSLFDIFLAHLRGQKLVVGMGEWLDFLGGLKVGLATSPLEMYHLGRSIICRTEADFDQYDVAFAASFAEATLTDELRAKLLQWLEKKVERPLGPFEEHEYKSQQELWEAFLDRLREQKEEHHGGDHWVGTGGSSPFGHSGRGAAGIRVGGPGGGRQAVRVAMERQWSNYRRDQVLDTRDMKVALRALRSLAREGQLELDVEETIAETSRQGGEIELVERPARVNRVHLVLLMDAGGSMTPHSRRVSQLFSAAHQVRVFKTFKAYYFHNCVYNWLYKDISRLDRVPTSGVLDGIGTNHRVIFVGDASMAPYELLSPYGWYEENKVSGFDWLRRFRDRSKATVWLNPDPTRYWQHPTVEAIGRLFPMYELTLDGLQHAIKRLRVPV
jgi:uncharacterized protein with von Willebrand factor type A (vWA) domain